MRDDAGTARIGMPAIMAAALAWATGLCLGAWIGGSWQWLLGAGIVGAVGVMRGKRQVAGRQTTGKFGRVMGLMAVAMVGAGWWDVREGGAGELERALSGGSVLMDVQGMVVEGPVVETQEAEGLGKYVFIKPRTRWVVAVERVHGHADVNVGGRLLVSLGAVDTRWGIGDRVKCQGWVGGLGAVMNPGEKDGSATFRREGIVGRMWLRSRDNMQLVERAGVWSWRAMRERWGQVARRALNDGLNSAIARPQTQESAPAMEAGEGNAIAFIGALVLGHRRAELEEVYSVFRLTGLAHVLSISGLHVGLVAMGAWMGVMVATGRPRWAAICALLAVAGYVWVVPWKVPIVRAGFMAAGWCVGLAWGRRMRAAAILGWMALIWLVIRPGDLFDAGFQLSYGIVAGLLLWTDPLARWTLPEVLWSAEQERWWWAARRWAVQYLSVGVVAWLVGMPIVAAQFGMINPLAVLVGLVMLPVLAVMLWAGLAKVVVGMIWPGAGAAMGGVVLAMGEGCVDAVTWISRQPGMALEVGEVSVVWAGAVMAVVVAMLSGWFAKRYWALAGCVLVLGVGWLIGNAKPLTTENTLSCTALAVGDGSCFVVRSADETWLFDCGSGQRRLVGKRVVVPALKAMGVKHIDTIVLSHGDFDHFSGVLEVCDAMTVGRVVTSEGLLRDAENQPRGATAAMIDGLRDRSMRIDIITAGWGDRLGDARVEAIWPPAGQTFDTNNDGSIVLRFTLLTAAGERRLMMNGDIQGAAMAMMRQRGIDVRADATDLPHHGSFPPGVTDWLARAQPQVVLQSTGPRKLNWDKWAGKLDGITRLVTARHGAITVRLTGDGGITTNHFTQQPVGENPMEDDTEAVSNTPD